MRLVCCSMIAGALAGTGCAHATFALRIEPLGDPRPTQPLLDRARALPAEALTQVRVSYGQLPQGLALDGSQLVVADPARYEVLTEVSTRLDYSLAMARTLDLVFYQYHPSERWKNPYCNAQVPLGWVTLGLWSLVPLHYPCMIGEGNAAAGIDRRRERIVEALVRATAASGGNLLVVTSLGDIEIVRASLYGGMTTISRLEAMGGSGFAIRETPR